MITTITVSKDSSGMFHQINDALKSIPADNTTPIILEISPGVYQEKLTIQNPFVTLVGMGTSPRETRIFYDDYALALMPDGMKRGTFRSYTCLIDTHDVTLRNLTIENGSGDSKTHGQAIALYADGDRLFIDDCHLLGHQDTLFTGPLPPKEYEPNGFIGPKQFAPRINGRQYYKNCYICGDIDFIFGSATAYFEGCTLESLHRLEGYVTASSTPEGQKYGYVFSHCNFTSATCPPGTVYLGRPWRDFAQTVLLECKLGPHIHSAGFHDWNKPQAHETMYYATYKTLLSAPETYVHSLTDAQALHYSKENVLFGSDMWHPW